VWLSVIAATRLLAFSCRGYADLTEGDVLAFLVVASKRAKYGKGIYTSAGVWPALAYGELTPELTLTFLVVQLHLGPMGLGKQDQVRIMPSILCAFCPRSQATPHR